MAITNLDIKILKSENMTDTDAGGGRISFDEVIDGQSNEVFQNIPRVDRTYGAVVPKKLYMGLVSNDNDILQEGHIAISKMPIDPNVKFVLYTTDSHTDHILEAKEHIENFLVQSDRNPLLLKGSHVIGQIIISFFKKNTDNSPDIGKVLALVQDEGGAGEKIEFIKIKDISVSEQQFNTVECGDFVRDVVSVTLTQPLINDFTGDPVGCSDIAYPEVTVRDTVEVVSVNAKYYGIQNLKTVANIGDLGVNLNSIYSQIVPTVVTQTAITNVNPVDSISYGIELGTNQYDNRIGYAEASIFQTSYAKLITIPERKNSHTINLNSSLYESTVKVSVFSGGKWNYLEEKSIGVLSGFGSGIVDHIPGVVSFSLNDLPDLGSTLIVQFTKSNVVVDLMDQNPGAWGSTSYPEMYNKFSNSCSPVSMNLKLKAISGSIYELNLPPGLVDIINIGGNYTDVNNDTHLFRLNQSGGAIIDSDGGKLIALDAVSGRILWKPSYLPNINGVIYTFNTINSDIYSESFSNPTLTIDTAQITSSSFPIEPYTTSVQFTLTDPNIQLANDNNANLFISQNVILIPGTSKGAYRIVSSVGNTIVIETDLCLTAPGVVGTVDVSTGIINIIVLLELKYSTYSEVSGWVENSFTPSICTDVTINCILDTANTVTSYIDEQILLAPPSINILEDSSKQKVVPGSVIFFMPLSFPFGNDFRMEYLSESVHGTSYKDDGLGNIYSYKNGVCAGSFSLIEASGNIDYDTGEIIMNNLGARSKYNNYYFISAFGLQDNYNLSTINFKTAGIPVMPGSFQLNWDGKVASSDLVGNITGVDILSGNINQDNGFVHIDFNGVIFPYATAKYNMSVKTNVALEAEKLGLNPLKLPDDGNVKIFSVGDLAIIAEELEFTMPAGLVADQVVNLPLSPITQSVIVDQSGTEVDVLLYVTDLELGTVTMSNPLDLSAYTQPLKTKYTIEEMKLVTDVLVSGELTFNSPLVFDFSTNATVSTVLRFGDMQAQVPISFSQQTWTGVWSDILIGNNTTAQYNSALFPMLLKNKNTIEERWLFQFTSATDFNIIGEYVGNIGTGNTSTNAEPINPATGEPYFIMPAGGWGSGWATGNGVRRNTSASNAPFNIVRTVLPGVAVADDDSVVLQRRGDAN